MSAGKHNITIDQGATFELTVTVKSGGSALNLSSYSGRSSMRLTQEGSQIAAFTVAVTDASNGVLKMSLTPTETNAITAGRYLYDLEIFITSDESIVNRLIEGHVEVKRGITR
jgi:hypothetical protein